MSATGLGCLLMIVLFPVGVFMRGAVLAQLWAWFVVPLGVVPITLAWALGIATAAALLTDHARQHRSDEELSEIAYRFVVSCLFAPLFALAFGWVYHSWM